MIVLPKILVNKIITSKMIKIWIELDYFKSWIKITIWMIINLLMKNRWTQIHYQMPLLIYKKTKILIVLNVLCLLKGIKIILIIKLTKWVSILKNKA